MGENGYTFSTETTEGDHSDDFMMFRDGYPGYRGRDGRLMEKFSQRLESQVSEDRYLPDAFAVAELALELGLSVIENSGEDAIQLRNRIWLEEDKHAKLKDSLIEEMKAEKDAYDLDKLEEMPAEEVRQIYRRLNKCRS